MGCINWAWKIQGLKSNEKVLLAATADRADKDSGVCTSTIEKLARDCGGWTPQQTNRVMKRLSDYGLVDIQLRYPGTENRARLFICNNNTVDAEQWRPQEGQGRAKANRYYVNVKQFSDKFRAALLPALKSDLGNEAGYDRYENWVASLHPIEISKGRLVCRVPNLEYSREIWKHQAVIIQVAKTLIPSIKRLKFLWDAPRKKQQS